MSEHTTNYVQATGVNLENQFTDFCNLEFADTQDTCRTTLLKEDQRALDIISGSITLKEHHYEVALPWKRTPPELPNN